MTTGRTIGAAVGAVLFVLFFSTLANRLVTQAAEPEPQQTVAVNLR